MSTNFVNLGLLKLEELKSSGTLDFVKRGHGEEII